MTVMPPVVSCEWLAENSDLENLVVLDIRGPADYAAGHIPGSVNEPFVAAFAPETGPSSNWIGSSAEGLWLQLPASNDVYATIGDLGLATDSPVVVVTAPNPGEPPLYGMANAFRVADTLIYGGIQSVAILDGGYPRWAAQGRATTETVSIPSPVPYQGEVAHSMFVSKEYVGDLDEDAVLVDARSADVYAGRAIEPFAEKAGHIPGARSLPAPWIWEQGADGAFALSEAQTLETMAAHVVGQSKDREIVVYCGVGGYASSWWYVLRQVLGYQNVKIYNGSAQEWARHFEMTTE